MNGARRLLLAGGVVTVLLALVAVASHARKPGGGTGGGGGDVPEQLGVYLGVVMLVLVVLVAIVTGAGLATARRERVLAGRSNWRRTVVSVALVMLALAIGLFVARDLRPNTAERRPPPSAGIGALRSVEREQARLRRKAAARDTQTDWLGPLLLGSVLLGLAIATAIAVRHRRTHGDELAEEAALALALDEVLADTLDDLRQERDPRKAVISAYARMERTFAAYRVPRDPAEAPLEYVARALDRLSVSGTAVRRLTLLFERAKFSTHEVDAGMKDEAIETLAALRAELEADAAQEAAA